MGECPCESVTHCHYAKRLAVRLDIENRFNFHALPTVEYGRKRHELDEKVHASHSGDHQADKSGDMLYIVFFHHRLLCVDYQQTGEESQLPCAVALAVAFALFHGGLDGLRNIACASDVCAFCIFVYDNLPVSILGTYNVVGK